MAHEEVEDVHDLVLFGPLRVEGLVHEVAREEALRDGLADEDFFDQQVLVGLEADALAEAVLEFGEGAFGVAQLFLVLADPVGALAELGLLLVDVFERLGLLVVLLVFLALFEQEVLRESAVPPPRRRSSGSAGGTPSALRCVDAALARGRCSGRASRALPRTGSARRSSSRCRSPSLRPIACGPGGSVS